MEKMKTFALALVLTLTMITTVAMHPKVYAQEENASIYISPAENIFFTNTTHTGDQFTISVIIENITNLYGFEFKVHWNNTLLNCTDHALYTPETWTSVFTAKDEVNQDEGYYWASVVATGGEPFNGTFTAANLTFEILMEPEMPGETLSCDLTITDDILGDPSANPIEHTTQNGYYSITAVAAPLPWLAVVPSTYHAEIIGEEFTVNVTMNNLDKSWNVAGVEFKLSYDPTLLQVVNVTEGPFLDQFGATFFTYFIKEDYVLVTNLIIDGGLPPEPYEPAEGTGTIATIKFRTIYGEPYTLLNCSLNLYDIVIGTFFEAGEEPQEVPYAEPQNGYYEIYMQPPIAVFEHSPLMPAVGETVIFDASASYDPNGVIEKYEWNFGDGKTAEGMTVTHVYEKDGTYNVTLTVTDNDGLNGTMSMSITVLRVPLEVKIDVAETYFRGETAEFYVIVSVMGKPVDAELQMLLYHNGELTANLTDVIGKIATGLYRATYSIPDDADLGAYIIVVEAKLHTVHGIATEKFQINPTMTDWNQKLGDMQDALNSTQQRLDEVEGSLSDQLGNLTTLVYVSCALAAIAMIVAIIILVRLRKK